MIQIYAYIYLITNKLNGKQYIGKTIYSPKKRFRQHVQDSRKTRNKNRPLYKAFNKYGVDNFKIEVIEKCDVEEAANREIYWIQQYGTFHFGYNATLGGDGKLRITEATRGKVLELFKQGWFIKQIARELKIDYMTAKTILSNCGLIRGEAYYKKYMSRMNFIPLVALDKNSNTTIASFDNMVDLKEFLRRDVATTYHIHEVCKGVRKTAYGYKWQFANVA